MKKLHSSLDGSKKHTAAELAEFSEAQILEYLNARMQTLAEALNYSEHEHTRKSTFSRELSAATERVSLYDGFLSIIEDAARARYNQAIETGDRATTKALLQRPLTEIELKELAGPNALFSLRVALQLPVLSELEALKLSLMTTLIPRATMRAVQGQVIQSLRVRSVGDKYSESHAGLYYFTQDQLQYNFSSIELTDELQFFMVTTQLLALNYKTLDSSKLYEALFRPAVGVILLSRPWLQST